MVISKDANGYYQGSFKYNEDRLQKYIKEGDKSQIQFAINLLNLYQLDKVKSFAAFYKGNSLYELKPSENENKFESQIIR